jgi:uncharacterized protein YneF (UPF0154 family)
MIIGRRTLLLIIMAVFAISIVNGIKWFTGDLIGIAIPTWMVCCLSVLLIMALITPLILISEKIKKDRQMGKIREDAAKTVCSKCGSKLSETSFGPFCEKCRRYE